MAVFVLSQSTMFQDCATAGSARLTSPMKSCTDPRRHGFPEASYHLWCGKYGGTGVSDAKRLNALEAENTRITQG